MAHFLSIFQHLIQIPAHLKVGQRNSELASFWKQVFVVYFHPKSGDGRNFVAWMSADSWKKFKKSVIAAIVFYSTS